MDWPSISTWPASARSMPKSKRAVSVRPEVLADHFRDEFETGQFRRFVFANQLAVAQDGHPIGNRIDLVEEVAHENNAEALLLEFAEHEEEMFDLVCVEAGGG